MSTTVVQCRFRDNVLHFQRGSLRNYETWDLHIPPGQLAAVNARLEKLPRQSSLFGSKTQYAVLPPGVEPRSLEEVLHLGAQKVAEQQAAGFAHLSAPAVEQTPDEREGMIKRLAFMAAKSRIQTQLAELAAQIEDEIRDALEG